MADFRTAYVPLKRFEGGWCNVRGDAGGETYAGIARNFFSAWKGWRMVDVAKAHPSFTMGAGAFSKYLYGLTELQTLVEDWYEQEWWKPMGLSTFDQALANELFEQAVNLGRSGSGRYVQRLCNALNHDRRTGNALFVDLKEDGALGQKSLAALSAILAERADAKLVVHALNGLQLAHYVGLGARNIEHRKFVDGWLTRTYDPE